jgi:DNA-binding response OmpR family regulator
MTGSVRSNSKEQILKVEADYSMRLALQDILERAPFITGTALDGAQALACFKTLLPDLIILDPIIPDENGFSICLDIRTFPNGKHTPILIVTQPDDSESIQCGFEQGLRISLASRSISFSWFIRYAACWASARS